MTEAVRKFRWERVRRWTSDLVVSRLDDIEACFHACGVAAPVHAWSPAAAALPAAPMQVLLRHWLEIGGGRAPHFRDLDPGALLPALGYVNILQAEPGTDDLRYRLFGSIVAAISGFDMTGRLLSEHPASPHVVEFSLASANACIRRGEPLFTQREPAGAELTFRWPRLLLPLADSDGSIVRTVSAIVPLNRRGEVIR